MTEVPARFSGDYLDALRGFLANEGEPALQRAYELGRKAIADGLGVLEMTRLHQAALESLIASGSQAGDGAGWIHAAAGFLMEALSPFEATHRGFMEAFEQLRELNGTLEQRNAELKAINAEIKTRERQLAEAQRMAQLGSWEWEMHDGRVSWSAELYRIFQREPSDFVATFESYLECVHPEDRARTRQVVESAVRELTHFSSEERIQRPDGEVRFLHSEGDVVKDRNGNALRMVGFCQDVTERRRVEQALRESKEHYFQLFQQARRMEENLRLLSSKVLTAQEEERARISRELHDEVGQTLTAINLNLSEMRVRLAGTNEVLTAKLKDSQQLLEASMEAVHRFARELRPAMLDDLGLQPVLRSKVSRFAERTGVKTRCRISPVVRSLDEERTIVIYRIVQESLNNIMKHAQASRVELDIRRQGQSVCVAIKDDGQGFCRESQAGLRPTQRLGLLGMQERVRLVDGELTIESECGKGTLIRAIIPLKARSAADRQSAAATDVVGSRSNEGQPTPIML